MHALIVDGKIVRTGPLPGLWFDGDRWWDWRDDHTTAPGRGWLPVARTDRPEPADGMTHDWSIQLVEGQPTETWTERPLTPAEVEADARMTSFEDRLGLVEKAVFGSPPDPDDPESPDVHDWNHYGGVVPPQALLSDGGKVWRNVSGVPLTTPPSGFTGWTVANLAHLWKLVIDTPSGPAVVPWATGQSVKKDDLRSHDGKVWRAKLDHTTHAGWIPGPATHAVWGLV